MCVGLTMTRREWQILATLDYPFLSSIFGLPRFLPRLLAITHYPLPLVKIRTVAVGRMNVQKGCKNGWQDSQDSPRWSTVHRCYVLHTVHMTSAYISLISSFISPIRFFFFFIFCINCNSFHAHDSTSARAAWGTFALKRMQIHAYI